MKEETVERLTGVEICSEGEGHHLIEDEIYGHIVCQECGMIIEDKQFYKKAGGGVKHQEYKDRNPENLSVYDKNLGSIIGYDIKNKFPPATHFRIDRLKKINKYGSSQRRKFNMMRTPLKLLLGKLNAEKVVKDEAIKILRRFVEAGIRFKELDPVIPAIIHISYRINKLTESLTEISEKSSIDRTKIGRYVRRLIYGLDIETSALTVKGCIWKVSGRTGISEKSKKIALKIIDSVEQKKKAILQGKNPWGFAAAALYLACINNDEGKTQREIADKAKVTEPTLRARAKEIKEIVPIFLN